MLKIDWIFISYTFLFFLCRNYNGVETLEKLRNKEAKALKTHWGKRKRMKIVLHTPCQIECECSWKPQNMRKEFSGKYLQKMKILSVSHFQLYTRLLWCSIALNVFMCVENNETTERNEKMGGANGINQPIKLQREKARLVMKRTYN